MPTIAICCWRALPAEAWITAFGARPDYRRRGIADKLRGWHIAE